MTGVAMFVPDWAVPVLAFVACVWAGFLLGRALGRWWRGLGVAIAMLDLGEPEPAAKKDALEMRRRASERNWARMMGAGIKRERGE